MRFPRDFCFWKELQYEIRKSGRRDELCKDVMSALDKAAAQGVKRGKNRCVFKAQLEAAELMCVAAKNWHAVKHVRIFGRCSKTVVNGEGGAVAGFLRHAQQFVIIGAAGISDEVDGLIQTPFEGLLGILELMLNLVGRNLVDAGCDSVWLSKSMMPLCCISSTCDHVM